MSLEDAGQGEQRRAVGLGCVPARLGGTLLVPVFDSRRRQKFCSVRRLSRAEPLLRALGTAHSPPDRPPVPLVYYSIFTSLHLDQPQ